MTGWSKAEASSTAWGPFESHLVTRLITAPRSPMVNRSVGGMKDKREGVSGGAFVRRAEPSAANGKDSSFPKRGVLLFHHRSGLSKDVGVVLNIFVSHGDVASVDCECPNGEHRHSDEEDPPHRVVGQPRESDQS